MRIAKLKLATVFAVATIGLAGTGVMVGIGQEKKADPTPANESVAKQAPPKTDAKVPFETAFPEIKAYTGKAGECPRLTGKQSIPADEKDLLRRLAKAEVDAWVQSAQMYRQAIEAGQLDFSTFLNLMLVYNQIPKVAIDAVGQAEEAVGWYEESVSMLKYIEDIFVKRLAAGSARPQEVLQVKATRLGVERELIKLKRLVAHNQGK